MAARRKKSSKKKGKKSEKVETTWPPIPKTLGGWKRVAARARRELEFLQDERAQATTNVEREVIDEWAAKSKAKLQNARAKISSWPHRKRGSRDSES